MKKILVGSVLLLTVFVYSFFAKGQNQTTSNIPNSSSTDTSSSDNTKQSSNSATPTATISAFKNGTYIGDTTDAFYGKVQVQAVITNGKISDVQFLQFPNASGHTSEVSNQSMPLLKQEAIQSQNANVDVVSGATQTSQAFVQSLQSALDKAKS